MKLRNFINNIPKEEIGRKNQEQLQETEEMFNDFQEAFKKDCCALCGNKLDYFNEFESCFHWFTKPNGIKKKHFKDYLSEPIGYFNLESYFRWMSSLLNPLKNINDLSDEMTKSKLREVTIKFRNIEWSLNYGQTDLDGHKGSKNGDFPHFYIQMTIDNRPFLRFNDFHIPFSKADLFNFQLMKEAADLVDFRHTHGEGMSFIENPENLKELDKIMKTTEDESNALFDTSSMITMPEGKTMSGEVLEKIFAESRETKIPIRKLIEKYYSEAKIITEIRPGAGVPDMKKRNKRKKA